MSEGGLPAELPRGWARVRLGDILARIETGKSYKCEPRPASTEEWGVIKVSAMTWGDFNETENKAVPAGFSPNTDYEIRPGDILLSRANTAAHVGASVIVRKCRPRLLLSDKSLRLIPAEGINREWLAYLLSSPQIRGQISEQATGTKDSMRNISQGTLGNIKCWLPPLGEQRRMVAALDEQLSRLGAVEGSIARATQRAHHLNRSALNEYFTSSKAGARLWPLKTLESVAHIQGGQTPHKDFIKFHDAWSPDLLPFWKVGDMNNSEGRLLTMSRTYISHKQAQDAKVRIHPAGTVLIPKRGGAIATNKKRLTGRRGGFDLNTMGIIPQEGLVSEFLWYWFQSIDLRRLSDGSNVPQINRPDLSHLLIPVPDESEQKSVVRRLDSLFSRLTQAQSAITNNEIRLLRAALLRHAFIGRLVTHAPADESANDLLIRIRAEREAANGTKSRNRAPARTPAQRKHAPYVAPAPDAPPRTDPSERTTTQPTLDLEMPS